MRGIEDVGLEQMRRIPRKLMRNPRKDPFVQLRVGVVVAGVPGGVQRERPGVHQSEQQTSGEDRRAA